MGKKQKQQVVKQEPWAPGAAAAQDFLSRAQGLMSSGGMYSPETQQAQQMSMGQVNDPNSMLNTGLNQFQNTLSGNMMNPEQNPGYAAALDRAMAPADAAFSSAGRSGSGLHGFNRWEMAAPIYNQERAMQNQAMMAAPGMSQARGNALSLVGQQRDPLTTLQNYGGLLTPMMGMGGSQSSPIHRNKTAGALGGAMTGYQIGGPWGAAAGGLIGMM